MHIYRYTTSASAKGIALLMLALAVYMARVGIRTASSTKRYH